MNYKSLNRCAIRVILGLLSYSCTKSSNNGKHGMGDMSPGGPSSSTITSIDYDALYVVNGTSSTLSVVNTEKGIVSGTIALKDSSFPHHISLSPDKSMLMLSAPGMDFSGGHDGSMMNMKGSLIMLDAKTGAIMMSRILDGMSHNAAFSPDGKEIWAAMMMMKGMVLVLDANTLDTKAEILVGDMPAEVTFSSDSKYAFVAK